MEKVIEETEPIKILSLDDEEFFNIFLHDSLIVYSPKKVSFTFSSSIKEFFHILNKENSQKPDMIFLCLAIPEENGGRLKMTGGFEVLKKLKENPEFKNIPVVVFSRYNEKSLINKAIQLGAVKYLVKGECMPQDIADVITGEPEVRTVFKKINFWSKIFNFKK